MRDSLWARVSDREGGIVAQYLREFPVRLGALATELGIDVFRSPLPPNISGLIKPSETADSGYEIRVNKYEVPSRQRFTLAHEIAHFLIHKDDIRAGVVDSVMYRSALTSRKEAEANRLAADLVMPADLVQAELHARGGSVNEDVAKDLASVFNVSLPAMKVRLGLS